ncbi:hypothetical protein EVAR_17423_1 [Eumeta japonica]|uniref:Uncharacterized protein n=1 Tax=Eumeta variegata TaxID=151549 RepID=A0A4C1V9T9_EUMVA|nr:hypothetical protein EVAR_17423_1 [Eumeta japonica]
MRILCAPLESPRFGPILSARVCVRVTQNCVFGFQQFKSVRRQLPTVYRCRSLPRTPLDHRFDRPRALKERRVKFLGLRPPGVEEVKHPGALDIPN